MRVSGRCRAIVSTIILLATFARTGSPSSLDQTQQVSGTARQPQPIENQGVADDSRLTRSGSNDCLDLPKPPEGVEGLREYARIAVHHDGVIVVNAAQLPFSRNSGYLYRLMPSGWTKNEVDYILIRTPLPVEGGFTYLITFGEGDDRCGAWSLDATHPN